MSSCTRLSQNMSIFQRVTASVARQYCTQTSATTSTLNRIVIMGRLYRNPHVFHDQETGDVKVKYFSVFTKLKKKFVIAPEEGRGSEIISSDSYHWFNTKLYKKHLLDIDVQQGSGVLIYGRLEPKSYLDRNGTRVYTTEVVVDDMSLVESPVADFGPAFEKELFESAATS